MPNGRSPAGQDASQDDLRAATRVASAPVRRSESAFRRVRHVGSRPPLASRRGWPGLALDEPYPPICAPLVGVGTAAVRSPNDYSVCRGDTSPTASAGRIEAGPVVRGGAESFTPRRTCPTSKCPGSRLGLG
jgi:hypothetical protein